MFSLLVSIPPRRMQWKCTKIKKLPCLRLSVWFSGSRQLIVCIFRDKSTVMGLLRGLMKGFSVLLRTFRGKQVEKMFMVKWLILISWSNLFKWLTPIGGFTFLWKCALFFLDTPIGNALCRGWNSSNRFFSFLYNVHVLQFYKWYWTVQFSSFVQNFSFFVNCPFQKTMCSKCGIPIASYLRLYVLKQMNYFFFFSASRNKLSL